MNAENIRYVSLGNGEDARTLALMKHEPANASTGIFWLGGFKSSMQGEKASAIANWAERHEMACTRFDYSGHGLSDGVFEEQVLTDWFEEALHIFQTETDGPQIVVGSSMGGWLALLLAEAVGAERLKGLVLIAPAWDMTGRLMQSRFSDAIRQTIEQDGFYARPSAYGDGDYVITRKLLEDGKKHLIGERDLKLGLPVHILHGKEDADVPWQHGASLAERLSHDDVTFTLVPDGDHRLSRPQDITCLLDRLADLAA